MEKEKVERKLSKSGHGSMYVILPKEMIRDLGWRERQKLSVERVKGGILIRDWRK
jgi:bifunctional DNA-binding transcriptional regulator/antitoxin component of YhaV-PrlF toxin-antitoxin module